MSAQVRSGEERQTVWVATLFWYPRLDTRISRYFALDSLDESEASITKKRIGQVKHFGILHIDDLNWISPNGRRLIHDDMRRLGLKFTLGNQTLSRSWAVASSSNSS